MKILPIGKQDFRSLREKDYLYVDKTQQIYNLLVGGSYYFLSRPRRFGKSLTISTIKEIYQGSKALFEGLWIEHNWDWAKRNPVIHLSFAAIRYKTLGIVEAISERLHEIATHHEVELTRADAPGLFEELIQKLYQKHGKVVILIDEYDKPITDNLETPDYTVAKENRSILRDFYRTIKDSDAYIELFFMTGVSKFSQTGIFSHLNHLDDITIDRRFSTLVGYTPEELSRDFAEWLDYVHTTHFDDWTREEFNDAIKQWYNGYSWDAKKTVYNPFSILNFLQKGEFLDYWFRSGTPTFLVTLIKEKKEYEFQNIRGTASLLESYEIENIQLPALFFQAGYLTITDISRVGGQLTLEYPNREVEQSMSNHIMATMLNRDPVFSAAPVETFKNAFLANDVERVVKTINAMLKDVPSLLLEGKQEHFYHALVHLHFRYLGWYLDSEVHTSDGRMDAVVKTDLHIYIIEFKIDQSAATAITQIKNKAYAEKYNTENKQIVAVGINFDTQKRCVGDWELENL
jgi:Predicted AAA-ATPase/PD-(D/E)XK nuclease superfamily/PAS fold